MGMQGLWTIPPGNTFFLLPPLLLGSVVQICSNICKTELPGFAFLGTQFGKEVRYCYYRQFPPTVRCNNTRYCSLCARSPLNNFVRNDVLGTSKMNSISSLIAETTVLVRHGLLGQLGPRRVRHGLLSQQPGNMRWVRGRRFHSSAAFFLVTGVHPVSSSIGERSAIQVRHTHCSPRLGSTCT